MGSPLFPERRHVTYGFLETASTPSVVAAQAANGSAEYWSGFRGDRSFDRFTQTEMDFIAQRDSLYMATVSESGWPYIQHRGGPAGFLRVLDEKTFGFADLRGNRQYISVGNIGADNRVAVILMDYPHRARLKLYARAEIKDLRDDPALAQRLALPGYKGKVERGILLHLEAFDWNCPQHITPRFTEAELAEVLGPINERMKALEDENRQLRARIAVAAPGEAV
jgi:predicted pyridoxine 5'-phosphate oxidase superfamily flavin-nucleotide-binding protein